VVDRGASDRWAGARTSTGMLLADNESSREGNHADSIQVQLGKDHRRYARLDRFLLYLLAAELSYFVLLMFAGL